MNKERKMLYDYFSFSDIDILTDTDDFFISIKGVVYPYEMTLSMEYTDAECCRVFIDGDYYYFG